jgi:hypothetical protein
MRRVVDGREVRCRLDGKSTHDRCVAVCYLEGIDITESMVRAGLGTDCFALQQEALCRAGARSYCQGRNNRQDPLPAGVLPAALKGGRAVAATDQLFARDAVTHRRPAGAAGGVEAEARTAGGRAWSGRSRPWLHLRHVCENRKLGAVLYRFHVADRVACSCRYVVEIGGNVGFWRATQCNMDWAFCA